MILRGNILYMTDKNTLVVRDHSYLLIEDGKVDGVYKTLPEKLQQEKVTDYGDRLIIPGLTDLHIHAPQYAFRGLGMDKELLGWLNEHAFPEEMKYRDDAYAAEAYRIFAADLAASPTTRACIFATLHRKATLQLAEMLEETGVITYVGKVNMDRNAPEGLLEKTQDSLADTQGYVEEMANAFQRTKPILTPRFIPSCSDELMTGLAKLQKHYALPVQSHLSENPSEIAWVAELNPASKHYGDAYDLFGLFGGDVPTIMAHCVYSGEEEQKLMKERGVYIAHCPNSNMNLKSGIAPIRRYLDQGMHVGLGSDIAAGTSMSLFQAIRDAVAMSKLYWRLVDQTCAPITTWEAFYMATLGGGSFFGNVGSFKKGYEADVLVLDDTKYPTTLKLTSSERLERICNLAGTDVLYAKYVSGKQIF